MRIAIAERLHPFSHRPGSAVILPGSPYCVDVFPTKISISDLSQVDASFCFEAVWGWEGPVADFTVVQDLERGEVVVFGKAVQGYFRYRIGALVGSPGVAVTLDKTPTGLAFVTKGWPCSSTVGTVHLFGDGSLPVYKPPHLERLSLGSHKAQEWERMGNHLDFATLLPIWHRLGQMVPAFEHQPIFDRLQQTVAQKERLQVLHRLKEIYLVAFDPCLTPRRHDPFFQGIDLPKVTGSPLAVLSEGAVLIRSLFFQHSDNQISLMSVVPPDFHSGRMLDVACGDWGTMSFEWTKKEARRALLHVHQDKQIALTATADQHACRVRTSTKDRGTPYRLGSPLNLEAGRVYWFDCFTH